MPARIIKIHSTPDSLLSVAFNYVDLQRHGENLIALARREADEIIAAARRAAGRLREQALHEARVAGRLEGLSDSEAVIARQSAELAEESVSVRLATALPALHRAAESLQAERDGWLQRWEQTAVQLGVAIAEKLLQRQLVARPEFASEMISDALRLAVGQPQLTVYLHPDDLLAWGDRAPQIVQSLTSCAETRLVPDPDAQRGGCRIETQHGEIDARVETMLRRIAAELVEE